MSFVSPRKSSDQKHRFICRLPLSVIATLRARALMLEEAEAAAGNPPKHRRGQEGEPAAATIDYVLASVVTNALAKDAPFVKWLDARTAPGSANHTSLLVTSAVTEEP